MSFKFNPNPVRANFLKEPGVYDCTVAALKFAYTNSGDYYAQVTFVTKDNQQVTGILSTKPDKSGDHTRLNDFVVSTAIQKEIDEYVAAGEVEMSETLFEKLVRRGEGRRLSEIGRAHV
mgnify:CR=1 FL=1